MHKTTKEPTFGNYHKLLREERHLGAILFHLMQDNDGLNGFLSEARKKRSSGIDDSVPSYNASQVEGIYFEYAALRDIWKSISDCFSGDGAIKSELPPAAPGDWISKSMSGREGSEDDQQCFTDSDWVKRDFILEMLSKADANETVRYLKGLTNHSKASENRKAFNCFAARNGGNHNAIQSPSNWGAECIAKTLKGQISDPDLLREEIENTLKLKWSFNIKPDIVLEMKDGAAVCIELKYEGAESVYPASGDRKKMEKILIGTGKKIGGTSQIALQKFMLTRLLNFNRCDQILISKRERKTSIEGIGVLTWEEAFRSLKNVSSKPMRADVSELIERISEENRQDEK